MDISQFTRDAQKAAFCAQRLAGKYGHTHILPEHVLMALAIQSDNFVDSLFQQIGGDIDVLIENLDHALSDQLQADGNGNGNGRSPSLSEQAQHVLDTAASEAERLQDSYICTEHVLLALFSIDSVAEILAKQDVDKELVMRNLKRVRCARTPKPSWL